MPRVSVVVPTYDRADTVGDAIESVLDQTISDLELVVVDDASTDDTAEVVAGYAAADERVRLVGHEENRGGSAARNTGIDAAVGTYVAFLDSDDVWHPEKLERQLARLERAGDEWIGAYCDFRKDLAGVARLAGVAATLLGNDLPASEKSGGVELRRWLLTDRLVPCAGSTLLVERDVAVDVGGFDTDLPRYQDPDFVLRLLGEGRLAYVDDPLVTLGSAGDPSGDTVGEAADQYLEKHAALVETLERHGYRVTSRYELLTAKQYLAEGAFSTGAVHLARATVYPTELPGVAHAVASGVTGERNTGRTTLAAVAVLAVAAVVLVSYARTDPDA